MSDSPMSDLSVVERLLRAYQRLRCAAGVHRLSAWHRRESFGQEKVVPKQPRSVPGPGDVRRCDACGARWVGAYDGLSPFWQRER